MIPAALKGLLVPGSVPFLLFALFIGTMLLYRRKDGGRAGRVWIAAFVLSYWVMSTPATASGLIRLFTPAYPPVQGRADARGATAIVVLSAGLHVHHSRGDVFEALPRESVLRSMETARVYRILDHPLVIVTGGLGSERQSEAARMAIDLRAMGVPADRIILEERATNTNDHARFVPPLLRSHHVEQFVLVTSRQHIDRALRVFRKAGFDPVPSSPDLDLNEAVAAENFLPSEDALAASRELIYDKLGLVYYRLRGWI